LTAANRAFELDPQLPEALSARARTFLAQQNYTEAINYARRAVERKPDCEGAWDVLGRALFTADRWKEAADVVDRAIEASGDDYNLYIPYMNALLSLNEAEAVQKLRNKFVNVLEQQIELVPQMSARASCSPTPMPFLATRKTPRNSSRKLLQCAPTIPTPSTTQRGRMGC